MPRRKNNLPVKEKRFIATRLMQISLMVDDYVYQQKPMSEKSAVVYIKEIATYKEKCYQDARSLQVIDKLTRCITAIIHEQQELHSAAGAEDINAPQYKGNETNEFSVPYKAQENDNNVMLSPVYSEIDEDLTQIPQYFEIENDIGLTARYIANDFDSNKDYNNQTEIVSLGRNEMEPNSTITGVQNKDAAGISIGMESFSEVINLCDEDIDELIQNDTSFRHEPEFNIHKAISNLSISDIDETITNFSQQCSQSILDSNKPNSTYQSQDKMVPPINNDDVVRKTPILQKPATEMISFSHGPAKIVLPTSKQKLKNQANINKPVMKYTEAVQEIETVFTETTAPKNQKQTKRNYRKAVNASETNVKNGTEKRKAKKAKEKPMPKLYANKNKPTCMQSHQTDINMKTSTYQDIQTTASTNTNFMMSHDTSENAVTPIQNKIKTTYVQNLSWVENIRFVREIQVEEFEPFNDEGFWENCDLPAKFNEEDFNY